MFNYMENLEDIKEGNIFYFNPKHSFDKNDKCKFCGMSKEESKKDSMENYTYAFIHENVAVKIKNLKDINMKFDVIIGNPPYQLDGASGGTNAKSIYNLFVEQAILLNPRYISMIIPSRWMTGGRGLESFRKSLLNSKNIKKIVDFYNASQCFPSVEITGGVNYFLWDKEYRGLCDYIQVDENGDSSSSVRDLSENEIFIRDNIGIKISKKVKSVKYMDEFVSADTPFGLATNFKEYKTIPFEDCLLLRGNKNNMKTSKGIGYINRDSIKKNRELIDFHKIFIPKAGDLKKGGKVLGTPFYVAPKSVCSQTYLVAGSFRTHLECDNLINYIKTKFFRFLVSLKKNTQDAMRRVYSFVPIQDFTESWTDEKLYKKYGLTQDEVDYIESSIAEMK